MNSAIILAGGVGSRLGNNIPKQFLKINGQEILFYSVDLFKKHLQIDEIIIVVHVDWINTVTMNYPDCKIVIGGNNRKESSLNGVIKTNVKTKNVLIHDAARPLLSPNLISKCIEGLKNYKAVAPIINSKNSLIHIDENIIEYVDRTKIMQVQTPQCFNKEFILDVLSSNLEGTDEVGMLLKKYPNFNVKFVDGEEKNFKITTSIDFQLANLVLSNNK